MDNQVDKIRVSIQIILDILSQYNLEVKRIYYCKSKLILIVEHFQNTLF